VKEDPKTRTHKDFSKVYIRRFLHVLKLMGQLIVQIKGQIRIDSTI
jgi:hypothetical protein